MTVQRLQATRFDAASTCVQTHTPQRAPPLPYRLQGSEASSSLEGQLVSRTRGERHATCVWYVVFTRRVKCLLHGFVCYSSPRTEVLNLYMGEFIIFRSKWSPRVSVKDANFYYRLPTLVAARARFRRQHSL